MRTLKNYFIKINSIGMLIMILSIFLVTASCKKEIQQKTVKIEKHGDTAIEIITENMDFQMPDTIFSGWNTFRYKNLSSQTHFFLVDKYPEGKTSKDIEKLIAPVFESAMNLITQGKIEEGYAEFSKFPKWFNEVVFVGGSGLLSPNQVGETTFHLQPGNYIIECYVKMPNGMFHTSMGMTKDIVVLKTNSGNEELKQDVSISISSTDGIVFNDSISPGKHIFSVTFKDQIVHENFVGHDINLVKLEENANLEELENWMNWANPEGLIEPAPNGVTFMGGVNDMPQGNTGYFTATLEPGNYAFISEVPMAKKKNMFKTFLVTKQQN
ncbi:hypothetical protein EGM88_09685 [Aureibaculum marinum]|uniref:Uncharacterized protein n=1 Tax=Aureibaculum marinum TaxID=2487930 RepID=A0A3N4NJX8_9FLAO|nr:hypothetical protein [Aureibaculum marinum]RPD96624.1 hypothetical protein EGM88_09685 [Aureibaculum marinum]